MQSITTTPNIITGTVARHARSRPRTPNWLKAVYAFIAGLIIIVTMSLALAPSGGSESLPPCEYEDSTSCYWDADTMGNGRGNDVVNR